MRGVTVRLLVVAGVVGLAGCSSTPSGEPPRETAPPSSQSKPAPKPAVLSLTPAKDAKDVAPGEPVSVTVQDGKVGEVKLTGADGKVVAGKARADGSGWDSSEPLGYNKTYQLTATATGSDGKPVTQESSFSTVKPARQLGVSVNLGEGETVGVGMPLIFTFTGNVADKAAAEKALKVTAEPATEGAFRWFGDKQVTWRPKEYWKSGTKIKVDAAVYGKPLGNGSYGREDKGASAIVGDKLVAVADGQTHQMTVTINDKEVKTMPTSMGKPGHNTPQGTYTVMSEHTGYTMNSATYGVPEDAPGGYSTFVQYAVRLSWSGIFYHSAPWSVRQQGHSNVSHGCLNLSTENTKWLMDTSKKGDIVTVRNSGGPKLEPTDGWSFWQLSWDEWRTAAN
ncbi:MULTISPECIES: Ig-like domain-containing protein [unclassified Amycolatopsis]|uniref:Ig-like domain-containing protein n=1 Tax=unclassified Amycolatopsis TaxID=2618356 RepID=UPI0028751F4D|nr:MULTISPECIES: Ig-like domain-containing protein [unclassified Amycolatopsis]MDS0135352.1 L,D-transpeptidase family protein [Amycolatopsis sp. 505]MDS0140957.1 L,D-transpeptidase family protein [Amycolatopsis sp. CM201R]